MSAVWHWPALLDKTTTAIGWNAARVAIATGWNAAVIRIAATTTVAGGTVVIVDVTGGTETVEVSARTRNVKLKRREGEHGAAPCSPPLVLRPFVFTKA